jgi:two-component system LytT family response regulator
MINMSKLKRLTPNSNGEYVAQLTSGDSVKVSRKYKFKLEELRKNDDCED